MVNRGPSRACETCKKRHKKCDETRPFCNRCISSGRTCHGYKDEPGVLFRHYDGTQAPQSLSMTSSDIPSSAPSLVSSDSSNGTSLDDAQLAEDALPYFYARFCVESSDPALSRGFLDGLQALIEHAGPTSDIAQAARVVALTEAGNRKKQTNLVHQAQAMYGDLLNSFQETISRPKTSKTIEALMTAVLLGIYEIVATVPINCTQYTPHVSGVLAILSSEDSIFDLLGGIDLFQVGNAMPLKHPLQISSTPGVLCAPCSNDSVTGLDSILIRANPLFQRATQMFQDSIPDTHVIREIKDDAHSLDYRFSTWPKMLPKAWEPEKVGLIPSDFCRTEVTVVGWPSHVEEYFDLYVAAVWNTYRKTHLMTKVVIAKCWELLEEHELAENARCEVQQLAEAIMASIPYHLVQTPRSFAGDVVGKPTSVQVGKPVGGLLLLHTLYVVATQPFVSEELRNHSLSCLRWIGENMGIGQAALMAKHEISLPFQYVAKGHVLIWAGMLLRPDNNP